ncbi:MAG: signal peptidase I [Acidimicrobiia bacterium]
MMTGVVAAAIAATAVLRGATRRFEIKEDSMVPHLGPGDWVMAWRRTGIPARGEIVVFADLDDPGVSLVKRVIGLPGERVEIKDGRVHIDGAILADRWAVGATFPDSTSLVPQGCLWVLGDNRGVSASDSRSRGAVPIADIGWKLGFRYWPRSHIGNVG